MIRMQTSFLLSFMFFAHSFSTSVYCSDAMIHYMDQGKIDQFHIQQLSYIFKYANDKKWGNFQTLLQSYNGPLNVFNEEKQTLMHVVVLGNQEECVKTLITKKAPLNCRDKTDKGTTPLHLAAYEGYTKIAKILIDADKTIINSIDMRYFNTPLHLAAWSNHFETVKMLLDAGADTAITNRLGSTPIHSAAWKDSAESLAILVRYSKRGSATQANTTGKGNTPLYLAAKAGSYNCLQWLIGDLKTKLEDTIFINHLNQECASDNSTCVQAAGYRKNIQCYWNLVLAGAHYCNKIKCGKRSYISEEITKNNPVKKFIQTIEQKGKNNPPHYNGANTACLTCNTGYKNNDIVVNLTSCNHSFHEHCFKNHAVENTIVEYKNSGLMKEIIKNNPSPQELRHDVLTNPFVSLDWNIVEKCPHCSQKISFDEHGEIAVFLNS